MQAVQPGPTREPAVVAAVLVKLETLADDGQLDVEELENALDAEFPWLNQFIFQSRQLQPEELETWLQTIRWLMESLLAADMSANGNAKRVQVLLTALGILDIGYEGLSAVSDRFTGSHVPTSIVAILQTFSLVPEGLNTRTKEWLQELSCEVKAGNLKMLQHAQHALQLQFHSDICTCIFLLWKLEPTELASLINSHDCILWDMLLCRVLDANAPLFALQVEKVPFKFISLLWLEHMKQIYPEIDVSSVLEQLLLQVARTPHWKGWLEANYAYPTAGSEHSRALAEALTQLEEPHWKEFISALPLSTLGDSAKAVSDILTHVARKLGSAKVQPIWLMAFERWNVWDYGRFEMHPFLSSPQICTLDFPVAMYYSNMLPAERNALERELQNAIYHIEQRWFSSESELCTERNRLASRLRLVRHGSALAAGDTCALPAPVQADNEYAAVRYRYHDVNSLLDNLQR